MNKRKLVKKSDLLFNSIRLHKGKILGRNIVFSFYSDKGKINQLKLTTAQLLNKLKFIKSHHEIFKCYPYYSKLL